MLLFLCALTAVAAPAAVLLEPTGHGAWEGAGLAAVTAAALAVPQRHRELAASVAAFALLLATAVLVHVSGGMIEMHFLFFVIVAAVTLYQQWAPFLTAVAFVVLHHGVLGTLRPADIYNHPAALERPWLWALVHGGFVALASAVGLAAWRFEESVRGELGRVGEQHRVVLDSVADAVLALDPEGRVVSANRPAAALLGAPERFLLRQHVHDLLHGEGDVAGHGRGGCPFTTPEDGTGTDTLVRRRAWLPTPPVPVRFHRSVVGSAGGTSLVLTLTDLSSDQRLREAEARLEDVAAARRLERAEVEQLVASVQPAPLSAPGVEVAATYLPAAGSLIGGDLYDWFVDPEGTVHVCVIDAMGKGVSATHQAIAVLHALRVLALDGQPLQDVVARADRVLTRHDPELAATAVLARYEATSGVLRIASAGHPPALLVRPDGSTDYLSTVGIGIGVPGAGSTVTAEVRLEPGECVVLYTDGLIEGTRDLDRGLADLARVAGSHAGADPAHLAALLVCEPASARVDDDRVALVLRRPAAGGTAPHGTDEAPPP